MSTKGNSLNVSHDDNMEAWKVPSGTLLLQSILVRKSVVFVVYDAYYTPATSLIGTYPNSST